LHSILHPNDLGIKWNGIQMWRGAVNWPAFDGGGSMLIAGDGVAKLVLYPVGPGHTAETRLTNWVIYARVADPGEPPPQRENWSRLGRYDSFRHLAERLHLPFIDVAQLIQTTGEIFEYSMCDRDRLPWWTQVRATCWVMPRIRCIRSDRTAPPRRCWTRDACAICSRDAPCRRHPLVMRRNDRRQRRRWSGQTGLVAPNGWSI
jgi:hypothetical protein